MKRVEWLLVLAVVTAGARLAPAQELRQELFTIPLDTAIEVRLVSGETVRGTLKSVESRSFTMTTPAAPEIQARAKRRVDMTMNRSILYEEAEALIEPGQAFHSRYRDDVRAGARARISLASGSVVEGQIERFDGDTLQVDGQTWRLSDGDVVELRTRESDSLLNGTLIGVGVGTGLAALTYAGCGTNCPDGGAAAGILVGLGAGLGVLFDALKKETHEYRFGSAEGVHELTLTPILDRDRTGVAFTLRW